MCTLYPIMNHIVPSVQGFIGASGSYLLRRGAADEVCTRPDLWKQPLMQSKMLKVARLRARCMRSREGVIIIIVMDGNES